MDNACGLMVVSRGRRQTYACAYVPAGDVDVEDDEDEERDEEEDGDDDDEVELGPPVVHRGEAGRRLRVEGVLRDEEYGRGEQERAEPRHDARQERLRLGPHNAGLGQKI